MSSSLPSGLNRYVQPIILWFKYQSTLRSFNEWKIFPSEWSIIPSVHVFDYGKTLGLCNFSLSNFGIKVWRENPTEIIVYNQYHMGINNILSLNAKHCLNFEKLNFSIMESISSAFQNINKFTMNSKKLILCWKYGF